MRKRNAASNTGGHPLLTLKDDTLDFLKVLHQTRGGQRCNQALEHFLLRASPQTQENRLFV